MSKELDSSFVTELFDRPLLPEDLTDVGVRINLRLFGDFFVDDFFAFGLFSVFFGVFLADDFLIINFFTDKLGNFLLSGVFLAIVSFLWNFSAGEDINEVKSEVSLELLSDTIFLVRVLSFDFFPEDLLEGDRLEADETFFSDTSSADSFFLLPLGFFAESCFE